MKRFFICKVFHLHGPAEFRPDPFMGDPYKAPYCTLCGKRLKGR